MIVKQGYKPAAELATFADVVQVREALEVIVRAGLASSDVPKHLFCAPDIKRRVQLVSIDTVQIGSLDYVSATDFGHKKEVTLAYASSKLLYCPREATPDIYGYMLTCVDTEAIAVCQSDPVFIAESEVCKRRPGVMIELP